MRDPLNAGEGKVYPQRNTDGEQQYNRRFDVPARSSQPENQEELNSIRWCRTAYVRIFGRTPQTFVIHEPLLVGFILAKQGSRGVRTSGDEHQFAKNTSFDTVRATTSANNDRTQRCTQHACDARVANISLVTNHVAE